MPLRQLTQSMHVLRLRQDIILRLILHPHLLTPTPHLPQIFTSRVQQGVIVLVVYWPLVLQDITLVPFKQLRVLHVLREHTAPLRAQRLAHHVQLERRHRQLGHQVHLLAPCVLWDIFLRQEMQPKHAVCALVLARVLALV